MFIPTGSIFSRAGAGLGQGIASGFQHLGQQQHERENQLKLQNTLKALGLKPEAAGLPANLQEPYFKQALQEPSNQAYAQALANLLGAESQPQQAQVGATPQGAGIGEPIKAIPPQLNAQQATKLAELGLKKEEAQARNAKEIREFSAPYIEKARAAKKDIDEYKELIKLAKSGNIRAGTQQQILSKLGLGDINQNEPTQVAQKIVARLAQNIGATFGGRVTNFLEQTFQKSLPTLWNTPKGIETISELGVLNAEVIEAENEARKKYVRKHGRLGPDADDVILEEVEPLRKQNAKKSMDIISSLSLPSAKNYTNGTVVELDGERFKNDNGRWSQIEGE